MDERVSIHAASLLGSAPGLLVWLAALGLAIGVPSLRGARITVAVAAIVALGSRVAFALLSWAGISPMNWTGGGEGGMAFRIFAQTFVYGLPHAAAIALLLVALWQMLPERQPTDATGRDFDSRTSP